MGRKWKTFIDDMIVIKWIEIEIPQDDDFEIIFSSVWDELFDMCKELFTTSLVVVLRVYISNFVT